MNHTPVIGLPTSEVSDCVPRRVIVHLANHEPTSLEPLPGRPALDVDLIDSESTVLYNRLRELAGPAVDDDDPDDADYAPASDHSVKAESEHSHRTLSSASSQHPRREGLRSARPDRSGEAGARTEAIVISDSDELSEAVMISDDDD